MKKSNRIVFFNFLSIVLLQGLSIITAPLFSRMLGNDGYGGVEIYNIWMWGRSSTKMMRFILVDKTINGKESSFLTQLFPILLTF